jgi:CheY-like chemotaxis protein
LNARDAMSHGGQMTIAGRSVTTGPDCPQELGAGHYVCITVSDTGSGMDAKTLQRAAEPFFTTKGAGKGTGLGLSMVHGLAAQSGGAMRMMSRPGEGTTVELWLPVSRDTAGAENATPSTMQDGTMRQCRILVVDDDPLVTASTVALLEDLGHVVIEALSGPRALDLLRIGAKVDVVITDHAMPGMTGTELARQIRQSWPGLPVVLATGYAELPNGEDPGLPRLSKPYVQAELAALIGKVVAEWAANVIPLESARRA